MPLGQYLQDRGNGLGFFHKGFRDFILDRMPSDDIQTATELLIRWCNPTGGGRTGYAERWLVQHCVDTLNKEAIWSLIQEKNPTIRGQLIRGFGNAFKMLHEDEIDQSPLGKLFLELMEQPGPEYLDIVANVITRLKMFGHVNWRTRTAQRIADLWSDNPHAQYEAYSRGMELMSRKMRTERLNQLVGPLETDSNNRMLYARVLESLACATASLPNFEKTIQVMRLLNKNEPGYTNLLYSVHNDYAFYLHRYGKLDEAISNYRQAVSIAESSPQIINSQIALMNLSACYRDIRNLEGSLQYLYQALSNRLKSGESLLAPLDLIAGAFIDFEGYAQAADVYGYTIAYIEETHRSPGPKIGLPLLQKARALIHLERIDKARELIERARLIVRDLPAHHGLQRFFKCALSELLIADGDHQAARENFEDLLRHYKEKNLQRAFLKACGTTAQLVLSMGDVDSSRRLLNDMEEVMQQGNWRFFLPSLYDLRAAIFEEENEHDRAREARSKAQEERKRWRLDYCLAMKMPELPPIRDENGVVYDLSQYR